MGFADFDIMGKCKTIIEKVEEVATNLSEVKTFASGAKTSANNAKTSADTAASNTSVIGATGNTGGSATAGTVMGKLNKLITDLTTHMGIWTNTRAGYIDNIRSYTLTNNTASKTGVLSQKLAYVISLLEKDKNITNGPLKIADYLRVYNEQAVSSTKTICNITGSGVLEFVNLRFQNKGSSSDEYATLKIIVDGTTIYNLKLKTNSTYEYRCMIYDPNIALVNGPTKESLEFAIILPSKQNHISSSAIVTKWNSSSYTRFLSGGSGLEEITWASSVGTHCFGIIPGGVKFNSSLKVELYAPYGHYNAYDASSIAEYASVGYVLS